MAWIGGVDVFPGIRFIPESPIYKVRPEHVDVVVTLEGVEVPCLMVSQLPLGSASCFSMSDLALWMAEMIQAKTGMIVNRFRFTGTHYFPEGVAERVTETTFQWSS